MTARVFVSPSGQVTLPEDIRKAAHMQAGSLVNLELTPEGILLRPENDEVVLSPEWEARLDAAEADYAAGRSTFYESTEAFLASLDAD